jgi:hypothetical protein
MDFNLVFKLWKKLTSNALLCAHLFKFIKVIELIMVQIMGFVEDEKTFSTLTFMKTRLQNKFCDHLDLGFICLHNLFMLLIPFLTMMPS